MEVVGEVRSRAMLEVANEISGLWWLWIVKGILAITFGVVAWVWPDLTLTALIWILGAYIIADGIFNIIGLFANDYLSWGRRILLGIWGLVQVVAGIAIWAAPDLGVVTLMVVFGIWLMMTGVFLVVTAFTSDGYLLSPWLQAVLGILGSAVGIYLVVDPGKGAVATVWILGATLIVHGIAQIFGGFKLHGVHGTTDDKLKAMGAS